MNFTEWSHLVLSTGIDCRGGSKMYLVYVLIDPRDGIVRYVGITDQTINRRLDQHLKRTDGNNEKSAWITELVLAGMKPKIKAIEEGLTLQEANERETYWIQHYLTENTPITNRAKTPSPPYRPDSVYLFRGNHREHNATPPINSTRNILRYHRTEHDGVQDEWITMSEAAKRLGINLSKISRLAALNRIETQHNPYDERSRLVNYAELRRMFPPRQERR